jgi:hypothetical protein
MKTLITRSLKKQVARMLLGVLLFAQLAVAAYACTGDWGKPPVMDGAMAQSGDCCDEMDQARANLCLEHCQFGAQSTAQLDVPSLPPPALLPTLFLTLLNAPLPLTARNTGVSQTTAATPPPLIILHRSLRI